MSNRFLPITSIVVALFIACACSSVRNATPSQIGLLSLDGFRYTGGSLPSDTTFRVFRDEAAFDQQFAVSDSPGRLPNFNGQWVVAVMINPPSVTNLRFERAEVAGKAVNVYAQTCTGANCDTTTAVLATIPKVGSARSVRFFINGEKKNETAL